MRFGLTIFLLLLLLIFVVWIISVLWISFLTSSYSDEFTCFEDINFNFIHPWRAEVPNIRVMSYSNESATVYFYDAFGGEKARFIKKDNGWTYETTLAIWSSQGSADDCFIWPYYKHYVP